MFPVFPEECLCHEAQFRKQPCQQRQLEDDAHYENEHQEITHVGSQRDLVRDKRAQLILGQKPEREGEDQEVTDRTSEEEHECPECECHPDALLFVVEQGRLYEPPYFERQVGEYQHQCKPERGADVRQELRGNVDVDEFYREVVVAEIGEQRIAASQFRQPSVKREIGRGGSQYEIVEQIGHEAETDDNEHE